MLHFITGDRAVPTPFMLAPVAIMMLKIKNDDPGATFATGDNRGTEAAVALVGLATGTDVLVVESPRDAAGKVDWDARHAQVLGDASTKITFLHIDPLSSHIGASLAKCDEGRVDFVTPAVA